jgi:hypothetical protein
MPNKFYYFEEKDLVDILDKVYEEGWSGSLELKESFISDILKEHCKEPEVSIKSNVIEDGETRIYETTSITTEYFNNPQMLLNFEDVDYRSNDIRMDAKDINQFTAIAGSWPTDTFWTDTKTDTMKPQSSWEEFHSDGINNLNNQWRIK